jgi:hypothetical protein
METQFNQSADSKICHTVSEVVRLTGGGLTRTHIFGAIRAGKLKAFKAGRRTVVLASSLQE